MAPPTGSVYSMTPEKGVDADTGALVLAARSRPATRARATSAHATASTPLRCRARWPALLTQPAAAQI
jgi:hypothetical protein